MLLTCLSENVCKRWAIYYNPLQWHIHCYPIAKAGKPLDETGTLVEPDRVINVTDKSFAEVTGKDYSENISTAEWICVHTIFCGLNKCVGYSHKTALWYVGSHSTINWLRISYWGSLSLCTVFPAYTTCPSDTNYRRCFKRPSTICSH